MMFVKVLERIVNCLFICFVVILFCFLFDVFVLRLLLGIKFIRFFLFMW